VSARAWYLNCGPEDVGDRAILVGDRGRVALAAERLDDVVLLNEDRGLTTATGTYEGHRITVSAFGMGAPIAAVVLDELHQLGVRTFLRLGTVMSLPPTQLGDLVIADGAIRNEGTSAAYAPDGYPAVADHDLGVALRAAAAASTGPWRSGLYDSTDGFYPRMLHAAERHARLRDLGVVGLDMETSAVLTVARTLGARAGSLCAATVDAPTSAKLPLDERTALEGLLVDVGLDALARLPASPTEETPS
jgi:uridine phosphorylase